FGWALNAHYRSNYCFPAVSNCRAVILAADFEIGRKDRVPAILRWPDTNSIGAWHRRLNNLERERDAHSGTDREIIRRRTRRRSRNENHGRSFFGRGDRPRDLVFQ